MFEQASGGDRGDGLMMKEKFLLDANTFITPYKNYYPFDFASGFWTQLKPKLKLDSVYVLDVLFCSEICGEVCYTSCQI